VRLAARQPHVNTEPCPARSTVTSRPSCSGIRDERAQATCDMRELAGDGKARPVRRSGGRSGNRPCEVLEQPSRALRCHADANIRPPARPSRVRPPPAHRRANSPSFGNLQLAKRVSRPCSCSACALVDHQLRQADDGVERGRKLAGHAERNGLFWSPRQRTFFSWISSKQQHVLAGDRGLRQLGGDKLYRLSVNGET